MFQPLINVLVRTSNRPNFFARCYQSIQEQTHRNIKLIVSYDDETDLVYLKKHKIDALVKCKRVENWDIIPPQNFKPNYTAKPFPPNIYFNSMMNYVKAGYIVLIDDDKVFSSKDSLKNIASKVKSENQMLLWKVQFPNYTVPDNFHFRKIPHCFQVDSSGFSFHTNYIKHAVWDRYTMSDFRVAQNLYMRIPEKVFLDDTLVTLQSSPGKGQRKDLSTTK